MTVAKKETEDKSKAILASMKNAQSNMKTALDRISTLEHAIIQAVSDLETFSNKLPRSVYPYRANWTDSTLKDIQQMYVERLATLKAVV